MRRGPCAAVLSLLPLLPGLAAAGCGDAGGANGATNGPAPSGCIADVSPGAHTFTCEGLRTDLFVPASCARPGCGLVLELHGDTGTGLLLDANTGLMALGAAHGYVVVAPTGPERANGLGTTWTVGDDDRLVAIVATVARAFRTDPARNHLTGFSRGGYVAWRLLCTHADLFASVAPAAAGSAPGDGCAGVTEVSCPFDPAVPGGMPARALPVLFLIGRTDVPVPLGCMTRVRDQAIAGWALGAPEVIEDDGRQAHTRWAAPAGGGGLLETFEHSYETVADGPDAALRGHCIPGSTFDPYAPSYAVACAPPNAFTWGQEVIRFFDLHPGPAPGSPSGN